MSLHRRFYTEKPVHFIEALYTQKLYTEKPLHRAALHNEAFVQSSFYKQKLLHKNAFTQSSSTERLFHKGAFAQNSFDPDTPTQTLRFYRAGVRFGRTFWLASGINLVWSRFGRGIW